jgi:hypothetical protein
MKTSSFMSGWHLKNAAVSSVIMCLSVITGVMPVQAKDEDAQANGNIAFIEFLGEGLVVDNEYIDPLRLAEYETMIQEAEKEVKQQND